MKYFNALAFLGLTLSGQQSLHSDQVSGTKTLTDQIGKSLDCQLSFYELQSDATHSLVFETAVMTFDLSQKGLQNGIFVSNPQGDFLSLNYVGVESAFYKTNEISKKNKWEDAGSFSISSFWSREISEKKVSTYFDLRSGDIFIHQAFDLAKRLENINVTQDLTEEKIVNIDRVELSCASSGSNPESDFMKD